MNPIYKFYIILIFLFWTTFAQAQWEWINPLITTENLNSLVFVDDNKGFAVGLNSTLLRTEDAGLTWEVQDIGSTEHSLYSIYFKNPAEGFITARKGYYKTTDSGITWSYTSLTIMENIYNITFTDPLTGFLVGNGCYQIMKTTDGGNTWIDVTPYISTQYNFGIRGIQFINDQVGFASGGLDILIKTTDGGDTWTQIPLSLGGTMYDVHFFDENNGILAEDWGIWSTADGGISWNSVYDGRIGYYGARFDFIDTTSGFAAGPYGVILKTNSSGNSWEEIIIPSGKAFRWICHSDASHFYSCGDAGTIIASSDSGLTWNYQTVITDADLYMVAYPESGKALICGSNGTIMRSTDDGVSWQRVATNTRMTIYSMSFPSPQTGYAVGSCGIILKSTDGGENWNIIVPDTSDENLVAVDFTDILTGYAVGGWSVIRKTSDGGLTWIDQSTGLPYTTRLYDVCFPSPDTGFISGEGFYGTLLKTTNGGIDWFQPSEYPFPPDITSLCFLSTTYGFATSDDALCVHKTEDGGVIWNQVGDYFNEWIDVHFLDSLHGYVCGWYGEICWTRDGGKTWEYYCIGNELILNAICFQDYDKGVVVGPGGIMLRTTNGGGVGVPEQKGLNHGFRIYPNPVKDLLTIDLIDDDQGSKYILTVCDVNGRTLLEKPLRERKTIVDMTDLMKGVYFLEIDGEQRFKARKIIKE